MTSQSQDVEILVHVTAPSRSRDDVVYRQLAQAYLAFQPQRTIALPETCSASETSSAALLGEPQQTSQSHDRSQEGCSNVPPIPLADLHSQDLSFQSALDNLSSPALPVQRFKIAQDAALRPLPAGEASATQSSWAPPSSEISDSYPMPDADILHVSPTRVLQRYLSRSTAFTSSPVTRSDARCSQVSEEISSSPLLATSSLSPPPDSSAEKQDQPQQQTASEAGGVDVIPFTPLTGKSKVQPSQATDQDHDDSVVNETTHIQSSLTSCPMNTSSPRAESEPPPSKRLKTGSGLSSEPLSLVRSSSDSYRPTKTLGANRLDHSYEIRPPPPPVGVSDIKPDDVVSKKLAKLATDLSSRYRPINKRDVEPFERGYWLLDCRGWNPKIRLETWMFLTNYVGSGLAGWGVWCRRDVSHNWIRLYCWGHIAKHTYLLLYLASGRQLKVTGAPWFDADGKIALQVLPHDRQG